MSRDSGYKSHSSGKCVGLGVILPGSHTTPRGSIYTAMMEISPRRHDRDGLSVPIIP